MTTVRDLPARQRFAGDVDRLVAAGLTEREIAHELGVSRSTVWQIKQDLGLNRKTLREAAKA